MQRFYRYAAQNGAFALSFSVLACLWTHRIFSSVEPEGGLEKVCGRPSCGGLSSAKAEELPREIERRRKLGITDNSDIDPHPDDVLVDLATDDVYVMGELNQKDNRMLRKLGLKR